ncbi:MAG TPA: biotin--[acetyl-CoA-carboxylase] ligase [Ktedonobacteraceae bacterium]|nr:biotin--[acetyl-CoA-carboxylase] ligase [Ktedonobacteraceae bacterium]
MQSGSSFQARKLDVGLIQRQLKTQFFGRGDKLLYLPVVDSTNVRAVQLANERSDEGVVVLTDSQTAGKGRVGRRWVDVAGHNVLSSTLLRPHFSPHLLVMIASLAVVHAITQTCGVGATIKWPNDVLIEDHKVAGILIETGHDRSGQLVAIVGIGINVNGQVSDLPALDQAYTTFYKGVTTLEMACGHEVSRETLIACLLQSIEADYLVVQQAALHQPSQELAHASRRVWERWRNALSTPGRFIQVHQGDTVLSGIAEDVDDNGELLLRRHSGELVRITWGDVEGQSGNQ